MVELVVGVLLGANLGILGALLVQAAARRPRPARLALPVHDGDPVLSRRSVGTGAVIVPFNAVETAARRRAMARHPSARRCGGPA